MSYTLDLRSITYHSINNKSIRTPRRVKPKRPTSILTNIISTASHNGYTQSLVPCFRKPSFSPIGSLLQPAEVAIPPCPKETQPTPSPTLFAKWLKNSRNRDTVALSHPCLLYRESSIIKAPQENSRDGREQCKLMRKLVHMCLS